MAVLVAQSGDGANVKLRAEVLTTERLSLEPLRVDDARELAPLLGDSRLYEHIGGPPPASEEELRERFARQVVGESPDGAAWWLNWVLRVRAGGVAVGTFQATGGRGGDAAGLAWGVGSAFQRAGFASEAALAVIAWLRAVGVDSFVAH